MRSKDETLKEELTKEGKGGEYMSLNPNIVPKTYAPKSEFYGKVMEDGYVFNPFIHRRWLPSQYERMMGNRITMYRVYTPAEQIKRSYSYGYSIRFVVSEVGKLVDLQMHDLAAYEERKQFFDIDTVKHILGKYLERIIECLQGDNFGNYRYGLNNYIKDTSTLYKYENKIEKVNTSPYIYYQTQATNGYYKHSYYDYSETSEIVTRMSEKLEKARTYYDINKVINTKPELFNTRETNPYLAGLDDEFINAFWKSGVYYTIKNKIMFEHKQIMGLSGAEACKKLRECLDSGYTAEDFQKIYDCMG